MRLYWVEFSEYGEPWGTLLVAAATDMEAVDVASKWQHEYNNKPIRSQIEFERSCEVPGEYEVTAPTSRALDYI